MKRPCKKYYWTECSDAVCPLDHSPHHGAAKCPPHRWDDNDRACAVVGQFVSSWNPLAAVMTSETDACVLFATADDVKEALAWRELTIARFEPPDEEEDEEWPRESEGGEQEGRKRTLDKAEVEQATLDHKSGARPKYVIPDDGHKWKTALYGRSRKGTYRKQFACLHPACHAVRVMLFDINTGVTISDELLKRHEH